MRTELIESNRRKISIYRMQTKLVRFPTSVVYRAMGHERYYHWIRRSKLYKTRQLTLLPDGSKLVYRPYTSDIHIMDAIYGDREYFDFSELYEEGATILDLGAHIGIYALKCRRIVGPTGKIICIEPEPENFSILTQNIRLNRYRNIIPVDVALADFTGRSYLWRDPDTGTLGHTLKRKMNYSPIPISVTTLDNLLTGLKLPRVDLIKMDVEGSELLVLKGAQKTLSRRNLRMIISAEHETPSIDEVRKFVESVGMEARVIRKTVYAKKQDHRSSVAR